MDRGGCAKGDRYIVGFKTMVIARKVSHSPYKGQVDNRLALGSLRRSWRASTLTSVIRIY